MTSQFVGVALGGRAGSGKSVIARAILDLHPEWRHGSFAAALKRDLALLGIVKGDPGFREVAQAYGTEHARVKYGSDYWVSRLLEEQGGLAGLVIDDMRFENELDVCKSAGLFTVLVDAPAFVREMRLEYECPAHASESPPDGVHMVIYNDGRNTPGEVALMILLAARIPAFQPEVSE